MRSMPSFIRSSPLHHPGVKFAVVVLGGVALVLSGFDYPSPALIGIALAAVAGAALALRPAAGTQLGYGGMFFTGIVAFVAFLAFLAMLAVSDFSSAPWPTGCYCAGARVERMFVPVATLAIVLMWSLVLTRRGPRDLADADLLVLALGAWLFVTGGAATFRAVAREPLVLRCSLSRCQQCATASPPGGLACSSGGDALRDDLACSRAVPLRPAAEILAGGVTLAGAALAAHACSRRRRRAAWLARARRREIAGVNVVSDEGGTTLVVDSAKAGYRDASSATTQWPLESLRPRPSSPRHIGAYVIAVMMLLVVAVPVGGLIWMMADEAARLNGAPRTSPRGSTATCWRRRNAPSGPASAAPGPEMSSRRAAAGLVGTAVVAGALLLADRVDADGFPIVVLGRGPKAVLVEVAAGTGLPCDASGNRMLYRGWLQPGERLNLSSPTARVCFRQTYDNFPLMNWSSPALLCSSSSRAPDPRCWFDKGGTMYINVLSADPYR